MHTLVCRQCGQAFEAMRSDTKTCSQACRKAHSRRDQRTMGRRSSPSEARAQDEVFDLHARLCEDYYGMHPNARPMFITWLLQRAMEHDDKRVRRMLTDKVLVQSHWGRGGRIDKRHHYRKCMAYPTLPFEAHRFTMSHWGVSLFAALGVKRGTGHGRRDECLSQFDEAIVTEAA